MVLLALLTCPRAPRWRDAGGHHFSSHEALKRFNTEVNRGALGHRVTFQKNPGVDPEYRALTANLFFVRKA